MQSAIFIFRNSVLTSSIVLTDFADRRRWCSYLKGSYSWTCSSVFTWVGPPVSVVSHPVAALRRRKLWDMGFGSLEKIWNKMTKMAAGKRGHIHDVQRSKLFHSFLEKLPLVRISASWYLVSTFLIWTLGSRFYQTTNPKQLCGFLSHISW